MKVLELRGYKSYLAMQAFQALMLGLKMLPAYAGEQYEEFLARVYEMPEADQETMIREAAAFVKLEKDEVDAILAFCADSNGVPYGPENAKNLGPKDLHEAIVAVSVAISKIKINLISESEKKK